MKKFIDLTPKETRGLDNYLYKNAEQLKNNAILIANANKSFSCATSLLVLSSEEIIKASLVLLHSQGYNVYDLEDAKKFFSDHKIRHHIAQLIEMGFGLSEIREVWNNKNGVPFGEKLKSFFKNSFNSAQTILKTNDRIKKLQKFNDLKNNGLYVGYFNKLYNPEDLVTEKDYESSMEIVNRLFNFYNDLNLLFKIEIRNEKEQMKIDKTKEDLKIFIDQAMKDFSFKALDKN